MNIVRGACIAVVLAAALGAHADLPTGYGAHQTITFSGYSGTTSLTNFPALLRLPTSSFKRSDCRDLAVTDTAGNRLPYEIDGIAGSLLLVWVRIPELTNATSVTAWFGRSTIEEQGFAVPDVWTNAYAAVWHLNEDALDSTGHGLGQTHYKKDQSEYPPTVIEPGAGAIGRALKLGVNNEYVLWFDTPKSTFIDTCITDPNKITVSGWVKPANAVPGSAGRIFCWKNNTQYGGFDTFQNTNGKFYMRGADKTKSWTTAASIPWTVSSWSHLVARFDETTFAAFCNGSEMAADSNSKTTTVNIGNGDNTKNLGFGNMGGNDELKYPLKNAELDELRIYNGVASDDWVKAEYETVKKEGFAVYGDVVSDEDADNADGTWISGAASANWSDAANWQDGIVASGYNSTASFESPAGTVSQAVFLAADVGIGAVVQSDAVDRTVSGGSFSFHGEADITVGAGGRLALAKEFSASALAKKGAGELALLGGVNVSYGAAVSNGVLALSAQSPSIGGKIVLEEGATLRMDTDASTLTAGGLSGAGTIAAANGVHAVADISVDGEQTFSGATIGNIGIIKRGDGKLVLEGQNLCAGELVCRSGEVALAAAASLDPAAKIVFCDPTGANACGRLAVAGDAPVLTNVFVVERATTTGLTEQGVYATGTQTLTIRDTTVVERPDSAGSVSGQFAVHAHANADGSGPTVSFTSNAVDYVDFALRVDGVPNQNETRPANAVVIDGLVASSDKGKIRKLTIQNATDSLGGTVRFIGGTLRTDWLDITGSQTKVVQDPGTSIRVDSSFRFSSSAPLAEPIYSCDVDWTVGQGASLVAPGFPLVHNKPTTNSFIRLDGATLKLSKGAGESLQELFTAGGGLAVVVSERGGILDIRPANGDDARSVKASSPISGPGGMTFIGSGNRPTVKLCAKSTYEGGTVADNVTLWLQETIKDGSDVVLTNGAAIVVETRQSLGALALDGGIVRVNGGENRLRVARMESASTVTKVGDGTLELAAESLGSAFSGTVSVDGGTLAISGMDVPLSQVEDGGFEPTVDTLTTTDKNYQDKRSERHADWLQRNLASWTFAADGNGSGIANNGSYFAYGIEQDGHRLPQIAEGTTCAFLRKTSAAGPGIVSRTVATKCGDAVVKVRFLSSARWYDGNGGSVSGFYGRIGVLWDGEQVFDTGTMHSSKATFDAWQTNTVEIAVANAGTHTLTFEALVPDSGDCEALMDDVQVEICYAASEPFTDVSLALAEGAKLDVNNLHPLRIKRITYGGQKIVGTISADTYPEFVTGTGKAKTSDGLVFMFR